MNKILFVFSGNSKAGISPIIKTQAESLELQGIKITYYPIVGEGFFGYLKNIMPLRRYLKHNRFDIIHAHYSFSAFVASLAGAKPLVVSLMGSDIEKGNFNMALIKHFKKVFCWKTILKSYKMSLKSKLKNTEIIPNGVNLNCFKPLVKEDCIRKLKLDNTKSHFLFAADPTRSEKNFKLAKEGFELLNDKTIELHELGDIPHEQIPTWFNAADLTILTSLWEGSPNVIKEAMACNCPVVATNAGDVEWLFGNEPGHFIADYYPADVAEKMRMALRFSKQNGRTNGRERILSLRLDIQSVAAKIIEVYCGMIQNK